MDRNSDFERFIAAAAAAAAGAIVVVVVVEEEEEEEEEEKEEDDYNEKNNTYTKQCSTHKLDRSVVLGSGEQQVFRLEVAVDHPLVVNVLHRPQQHSAQIPRLLFVVVLLVQQSNTAHRDTRPNVSQMLRA